MNKSKKAKFIFQTEYISKYFLSWWFVDEIQRPPTTSSNDPSLCIEPKNPAQNPDRLLV